MVNKCDICEVEWNPQSQSHRSGIDCARGLKGLIDGYSSQARKLHKMYQEHADLETQNHEAILKAFAEQRASIEKLQERVTAIAQRVTILEHPEMAKKVPSLKNVPRE